MGGRLSTGSHMELDYEQGHSRSLVRGRDTQYPVCIDLEGHFDLGDTSRSRRYAGQLELAQEVVVLRQRPLSLEDLDEDRRLAVRRRREHLALARGDDCVAGNDGRHDSAGGFDAEREGVDVEQSVVFNPLVTSQDAPLDGGTVRHGLVRVDALRGLFPEVILEELLNHGYARRAAYKDDLEK